MQTTLRKWGNSLGLRVPKPHAADLGWRDGTRVDLTLAADGLRVRSPQRQEHRLADLVDEISAYNMHNVPRAAREQPPERGDLAWLAAVDEGPRRPVFVLSPSAYNARVGLALVCPVATRIKGYPFEVVLKVGGRTVGAVLADRVESVDWRSTRLERIETAPIAAVRQILARLATLVG